MTSLRTNVLCQIFIGIVLSIAAYLYPSLPEQIPTHWNLAGEVDDYTPKPWGVLILPLAAIFVLVVTKLIPVISPKGFRTDQFTGVGILFIILGNYLGKVRKNFFLGIRTPWTLASDEVWNRTHRLGARIFVLIGFFLFLNAFFRPPEGFLIGSIVVVALVPVIYSFVLYRKVEGFDEEDPDIG